MIAPPLAVAEKQLCRTVLEIVATELEVDPQELYDEQTEFVELGLDRNLASVAVGKIEQKAGIRLSECVFHDCPDVGLFKQHLVQEARRLATPTVSEHKAAHKPETTSNSNETRPPAQLSILIRGNRNSPNNSNLFLLPDGSGSAMCYARIPPLSPSHNLWALNSPFLGRGRSVKGFTVQALAALWADEILAVQPPGRGRPYALGGWSAGGYYAFEVARRLRARGLVVDRLILIDSPARNRFEAMPLAVVEYLSGHNLMGQAAKKPAPAWLVDHFAATLEAVEAYVPDAIDGLLPESDNAARAGNGEDGGGQTSLPAVFIVWAEDALLSPGEARRTGLDLSVRVSRFLLESRSEEDYGPGGWESLFPPGTTINIATMPGHHFNIVHQPHVDRLGSLLRDAVQYDQETCANRWQTVGIVEEL